MKLWPNENLGHLNLLSGEKANGFSMLSVSSGNFRPFFKKKTRKAKENLKLG